MTELQPFECSDDYDQPIKVRKPNDRVGSFFYRCEIDRDGMLMFHDMKYEDHEPILLFAVDRLIERGEISILDAGCGTGRTLSTIRQQLVMRGQSEPEKIITVGVNNEDFSDESEDAETRANIRDGSLRYIIEDLESVKLNGDKFDLVTSYETLIHNEPLKIANIIKNLLRYLKSDGMFIFNLEPEQRQRPEVTEIIENWLKLNGYSYTEYLLTDSRDNARRTFVRVTRA